MIPLIKWAGGKARLLPKLLEVLPTKTPRTYIEPFAGGAALFFALEPQVAILGDMNRELVNVYNCLRNGNTERVFRHLRAHKSNHGKRYYYRIRNRFNDTATGADRLMLARRQAVNNEWRAAAFLYFNRTCFNGLWRVNRDGRFNVPIGDYRDPPIYDRKTLLAGAELLRRATVMHHSFEITMDRAGRGDLIYVDPPYDPLTTTANFTGYTSVGFGRDHQKNLADHVMWARQRGAHVVISNSDTPFIWKLYPKARGYQHHVVRCGRSISASIKRRDSVNELIIVGPAIGATS